MSDDEFGGDAVDGDGWFFAHIDECVEGDFGDLVAGDADAGEGRLGVGAEGDVVKADEGDIFGDAKAFFVDGSEGSDGG